jgi:subtilisin-like proprotein convertase family protein
MSHVRGARTLAFTALCLVVAVLTDTDAGQLLSNRGSLDALLGAAAVTENFEGSGLAGQPVSDVGLSLDSSTGPIVDGVTFSAFGNPLRTFDRSSLGGTLALDIVGSGPRTLVIDFSVPVNAVGLDVAPFPTSGADVMVSVFATDDTVLQDHLVTELSPHRFIGIFEPTGIGRVTLRSSGIQIDNLTFGLAPPGSNPVAITIPDFGPATPYPSSITVSGLTGIVSKVTVTVRNVSHTFVSDLDILLVGPGGQSVVLASAVGGEAAISDLTATFDDTGAPATFPPTNLFPQISFFPPAPQPPYGSALAVFEGTTPNGTWNLFVQDSVPLDQGMIAGGWSLTITTTEGRARMIAPADGSHLPVGTAVTFAWTGLPEVTRYGFEFTGPNRQFLNPNGSVPDPVNAFGGAGGGFLVEGTSFTVVIDPSIPPGTYQVRVIGLSRDGRPIGTFSDALTLTVGGGGS